MYGYSKKRSPKQPDVFQKTLGEPVRRISGLGMALAAGLLGLLVLVAVLWAVAGQGEQKEGEAWKEFYSALRERNSAIRATRLEKLADEFSGTAVRPVALLEAGALLHDGALDLPPDKKLQRDENLRRAAALLEKFRKEYPQHHLAVVALERLALVREDAGQWGEALRDFEAAQAQATQPKSGFAFMIGKLLYGQARCKAKLGDKAGAAKLLEQAVKEPGASGSVWYLAAEGLLGSLRPPAKQDLRVSGAVRDQSPETEKPAPKEEPKKEDPAKGEEKKPAPAVEKKTGGA